MKKHRGFLGITLLVVITLAIAGGIGYTIFKNKTKEKQIISSISNDTSSSSTETNTPTTVSPDMKEIVPSTASSTTTAKSSINTSNWKTYTNTDLNFSIKYPSNMVAQEDFSGVASSTFLELYVPTTPGSTRPDNTFPSFVMTIAANPDYCGDRTSTILGFNAKSLPTITKETLGTNIFYYAKTPLTTEYGTSYEEIYIQQSTPCEGIEIVLPQSSSSYFNTAGFTQDQLINTIVSTIKI